MGNREKKHPMEIEKERLIIVEGKSDRVFLEEFAKYLRFDQTLQLMDFEDGQINTRPEVTLRAVLNMPNFSTITHLGIMRDADYKGNAFQRLKDAIRNINQKRGGNLIGNMARLSRSNDF